MAGGVELGVGVGLDAHQLGAGEGAQLIVGAVHGELGQGRRTEVVAQDALGVLGVPGAADHEAGVVVELRGLAGADELVGGHDGVQGLGGDEALVGVKVVDHGQELAVVVGFPGGLAAYAEEEGGQVPAVLQVEAEGLAGGFAVSDHAGDVAQGLGLDHALVIEHEERVVGGHGVSIESFSGGSRGHSRFHVVGLHELSRLGAQGTESARLHEAVELVLREEVDVAARFHVGDHLGGRVAFANGLDGGIELDAHVVAVVEVLDLLLGQIDDLLGRPNGDGVLTGQLTGRSRGLGLGGLGLRLGLGLGGGLRGALGRAGDHTKDHDESEYDS